MIMEKKVVLIGNKKQYNDCLSSVNTICVITMIDKNDNVHVINPLAKFGGSDKCISNTMGGGCCCHIDEKIVIITHPGKGIHGESYFCHPVTDVVIPGYQIPNWKGVCDYVRQLAQVVPNGRYIGWDIVILENGYDVIEGNLHPGQDFQGCDGVGRWYEIKELM